MDNPNVGSKIKSVIFLVNLLLSNISLVDLNHFMYLLAEYRIKYKNQYYNIVYAYDPTQSHVEWELYCKVLKDNPWRQA